MKPKPKKESRRMPRVSVTLDEETTDGLEEHRRRIGLASISATIRYLVKHYPTTTQEP